MSEPLIKESLFAAEEREAKLDRLGDVLPVLNRHVDFAALAAAIDRAAPRPGRARGGRPPFPTDMMVRTLLLQQRYHLSDEQMEFHLLDRLSFQRFVGLRHSRQIPDHTTLWTFRERLVAAGAAETLFDAANRELAKHGSIARGGQIIDASLIPVPRQRIGKAENELIQQPATPSDWSPAKRRQKDTDARWTKKHGQSYFGYQRSASADQRYKLIRKIKISTASENDTGDLEDVLDRSNTSRDRYGDQGYVDGEREARLRLHGWRVHIQRKARQGKPLSACQKCRNTRMARTRARVEHVAGLEQLGGKRLRGIGLARATLLLNWKAATYNLRRLCCLKTLGVIAI